MKCISYCHSVNCKIHSHWYRPHIYSCTEAMRNKVKHRSVLSNSWQIWVTALGMTRYKSDHEWFANIINSRATVALRTRRYPLYACLTLSRYTSISQRKMTQKCFSTEIHGVHYNTTTQIKLYYTYRSRMRALCC